MQKKQKDLLPWIVCGVAVIGGIGLIMMAANTSTGELDSFATCLKDKKATFYGAFWCPHCQNQKALFGTSVKKLPYVECSTPDGKDQTQICKDKKVSGYPTWEFADGSRESGEQTLAGLATKTGCQLPTKK